MAHSTDEEWTIDPKDYRHSNIPSKEDQRNVLDGFNYCIKTLKTRVIAAGLNREDMSAEGVIVGKEITTAVMKVLEDSVLVKEDQLFHEKDTAGDIAATSDISSISLEEDDEKMNEEGQESNTRIPLEKKIRIVKNG